MALLHHGHLRGCLSSFWAKGSERRGALLRWFYGHQYELTHPKFLKNGCLRSSHTTHNLYFSHPIHNILARIPKPLKHFRCPLLMLALHPIMHLSPVAARMHGSYACSDFIAIS